MNFYKLQTVKFLEINWLSLKDRNLNNFKTNQNIHVKLGGKVGWAILSLLKLRSIPNGHMHSQTYGRVNARVHEKVLVLSRESFNATTIFL